jgi:hypothetical protein
MDKIWSLFSGNSNILKFLLSPVEIHKMFRGTRTPASPQKKSPAYFYAYDDEFWTRNSVKTVSANQSRSTECL